MKVRDRDRECERKKETDKENTIQQAGCLVTNF